MTQETVSAGNGFAVLGLPEILIDTLDSLNFTTPTPIQAEAIPHVLAGRDILGEAQTGTGKTAAFGLPALARIDCNKRAAQLMVLAPTRELAIQVAKALEEFSAQMPGLRVATLYGGAAYGPQLKQLERGAQVVVGTPGRLMDHMRRGSLDLSTLSCVVLDEADEMLNMGFLEDIEWILEKVSPETQMALFSATMPPAVRRVAERFLKNPAFIKVASSAAQRAQISQKAWVVSGVSKLTALERICEVYDYDAMLVFVRTRNDTLEVAEHLERMGFKAAALNGDLNQQQRERIIDQMRNGQMDVVVATDVVARGLDIPRISLVVNYDLPSDSESYVHRIGRTGRAGRNGEAIVFARPRETRLLRGYEHATNSIIERYQLPTAAELASHRLNKCCERLKGAVDELEMDELLELVGEIRERTELSLEQIAAVLLHENQRNKPLNPQVEIDPPRSDRPRREFDDRGDRPRRDFDDRSERKPRAPRPDQRELDNVQWQVYRLEVGKEHGARAGDIVGAIANEAGLDGAFINGVRIYDTHTLVRLPAGMPKEIMAQLRRARVRNQTLEISLSDESVAPAAPRGERSSFRDDRAPRQNFRDGSDRGGFRDERGPRRVKREYRD